ncbi:MAG: class I SAM-dependent methyltransferase [Promethearchaeota archaeon]
MEKTKQVAKRYDQTAGHYNPRYREIQFEKFRRMMWRVQEIRRLKESMDEIFSSVPQAAFLDLGCGTCLLKEFLDGTFLGGSPYVGVDISFNMLKEARDNHQLKNRIYPVQASADMLPLRRKVFSIVFSFSTLQNLDESQHKGFFDGVARSRSTRSVFLLTFLKKPPLGGKIAQIQEILHDLFLDVIPVDFHGMLEDVGFICIGSVLI